MAGVAAGRRGFFEQLAAFQVKPAVRAFVWPFALAAAWAFDFLFWGKAPGISFPIYVFVLLGCVFGVARSAGVSSTTTAKWLVLPVTLFALAPTLRAEPVTMALDYLVVLGLLGLLTDGLVTGGWIRYRFTDHVVAFAHLALAGMLGGGLLIVDGRASRSAPAGPIPRYKPVLMGFLLALPLLVVFALLFASADPIFSRFITSPFNGLDADALSEISFRVLYVGVLTYALAGLFLHAVRPGAPKEQDEKRGIGLDTRVVGPIEGSVVLGSLNALFGVFVVIQFRYFFAGSKAITHQGMTYSEYARRGFAELSVVAVLTLMLLLGLSLIVRRSSRSEFVRFSALTTGLVVLTSIILVSAFQRLLLYEDAYGFTRLRTYSHVFMVWLAVVLVAVLILVWRDALRLLAPVMLFATLGFVLSLNVLGVDSFIARSNVDRAVRGAEFDVLYLNSLSSDAIPILAERLESLPIEGRESLSNLLVCKALEARSGSRPWQSFHLSQDRAKKALAAHWKQLSRREHKPICQPIVAVPNAPL